MKNKLSISEKLRKRRLECGFSLSELARFADTSPDTLSRYENDWTRFEVSTLRKLDIALGCRLEIDFIPNEETCRTEMSKSVTEIRPSGYCTVLTDSPKTWTSAF